MLLIEGTNFSLKVKFNKSYCIREDYRKFGKENKTSQEISL